MRYLGLGVGHKNLPTFPCEEGQIPQRVLIENDEEPWMDPELSMSTLPDSISDNDDDIDMADGRLSPIAEEEPDYGGYEW